MSEEAEKKDVVRKLEIVARALPEIIQLAKEGKISPIPHKNKVIIEYLKEGINCVIVGEATVVVRLCPSDLLEKNKSFVISSS